MSEETRQTEILTDIIGKPRHTTKKKNHFIILIVILQKKEHVEKTYFCFSKKRSQNAKNMSLTEKDMCL